MANPDRGVVAPDGSETVDFSQFVEQAQRNLGNGVFHAEEVRLRTQAEINRSEVLAPLLKEAENRGAFGSYTVRTGSGFGDSYEGEFIEFFPDIPGAFRYFITPNADMIKFNKPSKGEELHEKYRRAMEEGGYDPNRIYIAATGPAIEGITLAVQQAEERQRQAGTVGS